MPGPISQEPPALQRAKLESLQRELAELQSDRKHEMRTVLLPDLLTSIRFQAPGFVGNPGIGAMKGAPAGALAPQKRGASGPGGAGQEPPQKRRRGGRIKRRKIDFIKPIALEGAPSCSPPHTKALHHATIRE